MTNKIISKPQALLSITIILLIIALVFFFLSNSKSNIIYVDNTNLFNEFLMTKELIKEGNGIMQSQKQKLDSLYSIANNLKDDTSKSKIISQIIEQKQIIENFQNNFTNNNSEKIWKRINSYLNDYSQKNNLDIVIGVNKNGSAFYGKSDIDKTSEILVYINKRYEGYN